MSFLSWLLERKEKQFWYFKSGDQVTWNEKTGVFPGSSHLSYERELGKVVTIEEIASSIPLHMDDTPSHQYVKVGGRWFTSEWFKPQTAVASRS